MYDIILSFLTAFTLTYFAIPSIIKIAKAKHLYDEPGERRAHTVSTPSLGGIAIFAGVMFSIVLWTPFRQFSDLQYILSAFIIIFLVGAKDDIIPISPVKKLGGQLLAAGLLVLKANIKLTSLYGLFGVFDIPDLVAIPLSVFTILVIVNSFNLIDGINGLSGSTGLLISVTFGFWFYQTGNTGLALMAFALAGSIIAFLKYNFSPAQIFMGDTGSLFLGVVCAIMAIKFIELHRELPLYSGVYRFNSVPAVAIGILILPLFDTLRVFTIRLLRGKSPFNADRQHIHHLLLKRGLTHMQATGILVAVNICFIVLVVLLQDIGPLSLILLIMSVAILLTALLQSSVNRTNGSDRKAAATPFISEPMG